MQRFWAKELEPSKPITETLEHSLHLTQVALNAKVAVGGKVNDKSRTAVQITFEGETVTLGTLTLGTVDQFTLDLVLDEGAEVTFEAIGAHKVSLLGYNLIFEESEEDEDADFEGLDQSLEDEDEEGEDLEMDEEDEDDAEVEEVVQVPVKKPTTPNPNANGKALLTSLTTQNTPKAAEQAKKPSQANGKEVQTPQDKKRKNDAIEKSPNATPNEAKKLKSNEPAKITDKSGATSPAPVRKMLNGGLVIEDLVLGNGQEIRHKAKIGVKYIGRLTNGQVFDSSLNKPFEFRYGIGEVIKGWDQGLNGMRIGGKRKLIIPSKLGYGGQRAGKIPPNSTLEFEVELVRVQ